MFTIAERRHPHVAQRTKSSPASVLTAADTEPSLEVSDLRISLHGRVLVQDASFTVPTGHRVCLLGESGSGKSLTAGAVLGRLPARAVATGSIRVNGVEVLNRPTPDRPDRARAAMVFQDSAVALNPLVRLRSQLVEPLRRHRGLSVAAATEAALSLVESVGLPDPATLLDRFSGELSGGQRQRICIALALACNTRLMVADEPTSALDLVTQQRVLGVLRRYTAEPNTPALLFITHDFGAAAELCRTALVMQAGRIVERGPIVELLAAPENSYTQRLVRAARAATLSSAPHGVSRPPTAPADPATGAGPAEADERAVFYDLHRVSRAYPQPRRGPGRPAPKVALQPTSLRLYAGERVGIVGVSGSGKTTLLRLMLALEASDTGRITCDSREVVPAGVRRLTWYRRLVQYVPQDPASTLHPLHTVAALMAEPLARLDVPGNHEEFIRAALDAVGLDETFLRRRVSEMSGGQAQRLALARAIATRPAFLLADEPTSGLDLPMREQIVSLLRTISTQRGTGLAVVSHDLSMIAALCERTVVLYDGRIVEDRPTTELLADPHHPRTRELLKAIPSLPGVGER